MGHTRLEQLVRAPRHAVYVALLDAHAVSQWMVPEGMTSLVHTFEAREGGKFRISLTYDRGGAAGKSGGHTDTYHGHFVTLVPNVRVVQAMEFETTLPEMQGEMTSEFTLEDVPEGTLVKAQHHNVPPGVPPEDNLTGWRMALEKLARLVEASSRA